MKKISKKNLAFLEKLMSEFNGYSELVALNYQQKAEEGTLQWNRGSLNRVEEMLKEFAELNGVNLVFTCGTHPFLGEELEYRTVNRAGEDTRYHLNSCGFRSR